VDRISRLVEANHAAPVPELIRACLGDLAEFRAGAPKTDDLTLMAIRRTE
jgi:serine phosphatase RsbU (regulator of sigma subunit)